jgi:hypothetical protein
MPGYGGSFVGGFSDSGLFPGAAGINTVGGGCCQGETGIAGDGIDAFGGSASDTFETLGGDGIFAQPGTPITLSGALESGAPEQISSKNYAGNFQGDLNVTGAITAGTKDFLIDHPLDPANKFLYHTSIESSEAINVYTGNILLDAERQAVVQLPDWFEALNTDFRYQLTAVGAPAPSLYIAQEVTDNQFRIAGGTPGIKVSWQVTGVRHDAFAMAHPARVEVDKPARERGYYIHPQVYGAPEEKQIEWARNPQRMKLAKLMKDRARTGAAALRLKRDQNVSR